MISKSSTLLVAPLLLLAVLLPFSHAQQVFGSISMPSYHLAPTQLVRVPSSSVDVLVVDAYMNKIETYRMRDVAGSLPGQGGPNGFSFFLNTIAGCTTQSACSTGYAGDGQLANSSTVRLNQPTSAAYDTLGNVFICDAGNRVIRKVDSAGIISTLPINASSGGLLRTPRTLAVDANNNLYIGDTTAFLIFKVTPGGAVTVVAGDGVLGQPSTDSAVLASSVSVYPYSIAYSSQANTLVILDPLFGKVRELDLVSGNVRTILGAGMAGPMQGVESYTVPDVGNTAMTSGLNSGWGSLTHCNNTDGLAVPPYYGSPFGGNNNHYCQYPGGISVSSTNKVYVAMRQWVMEFTPDGIISVAFSEEGSDMMYSPLVGMYGYSIAAGSNGRFFVGKRGDMPMFTPTVPVSCPAGSYGSSSCSLCAIGEFSASGAFVCSKCPVNTFGNASGSTSCYPCPFGQVQTLTGQSTCSICSAGNFFNQTTMSCMLCPAGSYSTSAMLTADPLTNCRLADASSYVGSAGATGQATCYGPNPLYSDVPGSTVCKLCDNALYSALGLGCNCVSGSTWNTGGFGSESSPCKSCTTCNSALGEIVTSACNLVSDTVCSCDLGFGRNSSGLCDKCPINWSRTSAAQVNCTPCAFGGTTNMAGSPSYNACNNPQNPPSSCSPGEQPWGSVCAACTATFVSSSLHYCPGGVTNGQSFSNRPILCGTGKVPNANLSSCVWDGSTVCAAGSYIRTSAIGSDTYCTTCPAGAACAGGSAPPAVCTPGQYIISNACVTPTSVMLVIL